MAVNIFQMALKYISLFQSKVLQNLTKLGFLVRKEAIWQPCSTPGRHTHVRTDMCDQEIRILLESIQKLKSNLFLCDGRLTHNETSLA
jgi:hypothetical protein